MTQEDWTTLAQGISANNTGIDYIVKLDPREVSGFSTKTTALDKAQKEVDNAMASTSNRSLESSASERLWSASKLYAILASPYVAVGTFCYFKKYSLMKSAIVTVLGGSIIGIGVYQFAYGKLRFGASSKPLEPSASK